MRDIKTSIRQPPFSRPREEKTSLSAQCRVRSSSGLCKSSSASMLCGERSLPHWRGSAERENLKNKETMRLLPMKWTNLVRQIIAQPGGGAKCVRRFQERLLGNIRSKAVEKKRTGLPSWIFAAYQDSMCEEALERNLQNQRVDVESHFCRPLRGGKSRRRIISCSHASSTKQRSARKKSSNMG